jgi:hypothetical protein
LGLPDPEPFLCPFHAFSQSSLDMMRSSCSSLTMVSLPRMVSRGFTSFSTGLSSELAEGLFAIKIVKENTAATAALDPDIIHLADIEQSSSPLSLCYRRTPRLHSPHANKRHRIRRPPAKKRGQVSFLFTQRRNLRHPPKVKQSGLTPPTRRATIPAHFAAPRRIDGLGNGAHEECPM